MKWLALFWVYRREALSGWRRGWRKRARERLWGEQIVQNAIDSRLRLFTAAAGKPLLTRNEARATLNLPGWIERPMDAPEWSEKQIRRFYREHFKGVGKRRAWKSYFSR